MATSRTPEEKEAFLTYVRYLQSVAEVKEVKAKVQNAKERRAALTKEYMDTIHETLSKAKQLTCRAVYLKEMKAQKGDLENMNLHGNIGQVVASVAKQNEKYTEAGYVAIKTVKPVDKETLHSKMSASNGQSERHRELSLDKAQMKIIPAVHRGLQDLKRIQELKREIAEACDKLEFLKSVQHLLRDDASDSQYSSAEELEGYDVSSSEEGHK